MSGGRPPEPLDFIIWNTEIFKENGINGEYLDNLSTFTTEQILRFIRRCHMKWGDFIVLCKELRNIKVSYHGLRNASCFVFIPLAFFSHLFDSSGVLERGARSSKTMVGSIMSVICLC
ncbi:uncharacterized protein LOC131072206 isoform X3 [Cryptomeria japonica]|uniref:uncharacterized protein LOC131072206 isoform X3 n=1 Tax=Cryptomeria japonica TaxID=3369 RepID=UPI0025AD682E|nr:uncharacterized protein LOC131072206 isoform X3 [Cryptomeria japonica]